MAFTDIELLTEVVVLLQIEKLNEDIVWTRPSWTPEPHLNLHPWSCHGGDWVDVLAEVSARSCRLFTEIPLLLKQSNEVTKLMSNLQ